MNITRAELKTNAKARLSNKWGGAIGAYLIPTLISFGIMIVWMIIFMGALFSFASAFTGGYGNFPRGGYSDFALGGAAIGTMIFSYLILLVVMFFVIMPLSFGTTYWFYKLAKGQPTSISDVFTFLKSGAAYKSALLYNLNIFIRVLGWTLLFGLVTALATALLPFFGGLLSIASSVASMFIMLRYVVGSTILFDSNFTITTSEAIKRSIAITKDKLGFMFVMELSFIGWILLSMVPFVFLYTGPYMTATFMEMYRYIVDTSYGSTGGGQPNMGQQSFNQVTTGQQGFNQAGNVQQGFNPNMQETPFASQTPPQPIERPIGAGPFTDNPFTPPQPVVESPIVEAPVIVEQGAEELIENAQEITDNLTTQAGLDIDNNEEPNKE